MRATTIFTILLAVASCKSKPKASEQAPEDRSECETECVTPFGTELGSNKGVVGWSNCRPACIDPTPHEVPSSQTGLASDTYTGISWQCVEYARRWWLMEQGIVFGSVDTADDMWSEVTSADHLASKAKRVVHKHQNGGAAIPELGDLVIYQAKPQSVGLKYGHVAVVVGVDRDAGFVSLAEQNFLNKAWADPKAYARRIALKLENGHATLTDDDAEGPIYGWLRAEVSLSETSSSAL